MSVVSDSQASFLWDEAELSASMSAKFSDAINDVSSISILNDSRPSFLWDEVELSASLSSKFSDIINDDFLIVDGIVDDFTGLLDSIDAAKIFDETESNMAESSSKVKVEEKKEVREEEKVVRKVREDRSKSPISKRRRSITLEGATPSHITPPSQEILEDLQEQYKQAVAQLAVSMRRSEMTRSEIVSYRKSSETRAKLQAAQAYQFDIADGFLTGSRSTLTTGLEQSRHMLRGYMNLIPTPPF